MLFPFLFAGSAECLSAVQLGTVPRQAAFFLMEAEGRRNLIDRDGSGSLYWNYSLVMVSPDFDSMSRGLEFTGRMIRARPDGTCQNYHERDQ